MKKQNLFQRLKGAIIPINDGITYAGGGGILRFVGDSADKYISDGYAANADLYSVISYILTLLPNVGIKAVYTKDESDASTATGVDKLLSLLTNPMPGTTYSQWEKQVIGFYLLTGNGFIWTPTLDVGVNRGKTLEMIYLPTQCVTITRIDGVLTYKVTMNGKQKDIPADQIMHVKMPQFGYDGVNDEYGMSPLKAGIRSLTASNEGLVSQVRRFQNQYGDGALGIKEGATDQQAKQIQSSIDKNSGSHKAGSITVIGSDLSYTRFGISAVDSQLIQSLQLGLHTFCRMYNLPPELVDPTVGKTYNNVREAKSAVYTMAVIPAKQDLLDVLNMSLVKRYNPNIKLVIDDSNVPELQRDFAALANSMKGVWQITGNEFRKIVMGLEPIDDPDMDTIMIPSNLMPVDFQEPLNTPQKYASTDYRTNK